MEIHKEEQSGATELHKHMTVAAFTFIGFLLAGIGVYALTTDYIETKRSTLSSEVSTALSHINSIPSPEGITFQQQNGDTRAIARLTAKSLQKSQDSLNNTTINLSLYPIAAMRPGIAMHNVGALRENKQTVNTSFQALRSYSKSLEALVPFFEYSARLDTLEYDPSSTDTQERMKRLTTGLESLKQTLSNQPMNEEVEQLLDITTAAQNAQQVLVSSGSTTAFVIAIEALQEDAKKVVLSMHEQTTTSLRQQMTEMNRTIQKTLR